MSRVTTYTCDHCGAKVSPFIGEQWAASILTVGPNMPSIHGCSKEHLGFALAKAFGIPLDDAAFQYGKALTCIAELESECIGLEKERNRLVVENRDTRLRLDEQSSRETALHVALSDHGLPTEPKALARALAEREPPTKPAAIESAPQGLTGPKKPTKPSEES